jgi:hypothetical protein
MLKLLEFDFTIEYKRGKENRVADALSRQICQLLAIYMATPTWVKEVTTSYISDDHVRSLLEQFLITPPATDLPYTLHARVLRYQGMIVVSNNTTLRQNLVTALHALAVGVILVQGQHTTD